MFAVIAVPASIARGEAFPGSPINSKALPSFGGRTLTASKLVTLGEPLSLLDMADVEDQETDSPTTYRDSRQGNYSGNS